MPLITVTRDLYDGRTDFDVDPLFGINILIGVLLILYSILRYCRSRGQVLPLLETSPVSVPTDPSIICLPFRPIQRSRRVLTCYVDGSYSSRMQIGYSGFRSSDGSSVVQRCVPRSARHGSVESEVLAACLAMDHAFDQQCQLLIIYTDNSKVEQLLARPQKKERREFPHFCQRRDRLVAQVVRVVRVRGHPTREEQKRCPIKREFARIDRKVRRKTQKLRRRMIKNISWLFFYDYHYYYSYYYW